MGENILNLILDNEEPEVTETEIPETKDEGILDSIKKMLGLGIDYDAFDQDIIILINSTFSILNQLNIPYKSITGSSETWLETFQGNEDLIDMIKTYTYLKVKTIFDPPSNSFVMESMKANAQELEWRLNIQAEGRFRDESESK